MNKCLTGPFLFSVNIDEAIGKISILPWNTQCQKKELTESHQCTHGTNYSHRKPGFWLRSTESQGLTVKQPEGHRGSCCFEALLGVQVRIHFQQFDFNNLMLLHLDSLKTQQNGKLKRTTRDNLQKAKVCHHLHMEWNIKINFRKMFVRLSDEPHLHDIQSDPI